MKHRTSRPRSVSIGLAALLVVSVTLGFAPSPAGAVPAVIPTGLPAAPAATDAGPAVVGQGCAPHTGVTVVVDFTAVYDVVELGCALGAQESGFAALRNAGFGVNVDSGSYPGTVCTLDGVPRQGYPYCWTGGGFWSFWNEGAGTGAWAFGSIGAGSTGPIPIDGVQGWSWSAGFENHAPRLAIADLADHDTPTEADAALAWMKRELADAEWALPGFTPGSVDVGLTLDALLALGADGRSATPSAAAVTDVISEHTTNYVSWAPTYPDVTIAGSMAKVLFAAVVQGHDVGDFAGWDLEAELRSMMQTAGPQTGRFSDDDPEFGSDSSNGFSQTLAVLGLARTPGGVPDEAVRYLLAQQCPGGGFRTSFTSGASCTSATAADTDATAMAVQALLVVDRTPEVRAGLSMGAAWLLAKQDPTTGAFGGTGVTAALNSNSSGLAAQALRAIGQTDVADAAATWISTIQLDPATAGAGDVDLGAIAYNRGAFDSAVAGGIPANNRDQWRRVTAQAVLGFGLPAFGSIDRPGPIPPVAPVSFGQFRDVPPSQPFNADITWLVAAGVTTGYDDGTFRPSTSITRQANAAFLYRLAGSPPFTPPAVPTFSDVPPTQEFYLQIEWMYEEGLTTGYADGTFRPTGTVQRQATAAFLYRLAGQPPVPSGAPTFTDVPPGHVFHDAISWLAAVGVVTGYADGTFQPSSPVSRQAMAAFLHRFALLP